MRLLWCRVVGGGMVLAALVAVPYRAFSSGRTIDPANSLQASAGIHSLSQYPLSGLSPDSIIRVLAGNYGSPATEQPSLANDAATITRNNAWGKIDSGSMQVRNNV
ncbi:MAG: hypothetical protein HY665_03555, partial [Chloroflexi bacterium]|nr:hypothetical protein [Chloroflexota bacterium]